MPAPRWIGLVFLGGLVGSLARFALATWWPVAAGGFPWPTLGGNLVGALLLGWVLTVGARWTRADPVVRLLVGAGALGSFTTYSTLAVELTELLRDGSMTVAASYAVASLVGGIAAAFLGIRAGRLRVGSSRQRGSGGEAVDGPGAGS